MAKSMKNIFSSIKEKYGLWLPVSIIVMLLALGIVIFLLLAKQNEVDKAKEEKEKIIIENEIEREKIILENEYANLALEYDQYRLEGKMNISDETLIQQLDDEKQKVKRLLEELKNTKASDAKRIAELKGELESLRSIMKGYIIQIDSLNAKNQKLTEENNYYKSQIKEANKTTSLLQKDKEELTHKVSLASKLDAVAIEIKTLNNNGKETTRFKKIAHFQISFLIAKNITAQPGERYVYARIIKPDNDVLIKSRDDLFMYEDSEINFSIKKLIAYENEETPVDMYWPINEYIEPGTYNVEIFADGDIIGKKSFTIKK